MLQKFFLVYQRLKILDKSVVETSLAKYQDQAMRTIGLAYAEMNDNDNIFMDGKICINTLNFVGVYAIQDDVREGVKESIAECMKAGIAVKVVTGDTPKTAIAIARKINLWNDKTDTEKNIITGVELAKLTDRC